VTSVRAALTFAALTVQESSRRRVLRALVAMTLVLLALSAFGFSRIDAEFSGLTSGEARLVASIVLNLIMFGLSLIAALGTAFLAGPTVAGEIESGMALSVLARPVRRTAVLLGKWLGLVTFGSGFVVVAGAVQLAVVWVLAAGSGGGARAARDADRRAPHARCAVLDDDLPDGVGHRGGRSLRRHLDRGHRRHRR
jgi:ABC-type transport system involved in multi-copper enzyme maturation permease subunit